MGNAVSLRGERLRQLRLARGLSLDDLVEAMGEVVTKQALSKYERDLITPSAEVLTVLASALGVSERRLASSPAVEVVAFRKQSRLGKREGERIENLVRFALEERIRLQHLIGDAPVEVPYQIYPVGTPADAEEAAADLRERWDLGEAPIASVTGILEENGIHVIEIDADERFDGVSVVAKNAEGTPIALAVVTRRGVPGDRQRLNLTHELAHLLAEVPSDIDDKAEEGLAFRFGAALLAPTAALVKDTGRHRRYISAQELLLLKRRYGLSVQALLYRLHELGVINAESYRKWCIIVNRLGWRREEPEPWEPERPSWLERSVLRAYAEGALEEEEARRILEIELGPDAPTTLLDKRAFVQLRAREGAEVVERQVKEMEVRYRRSS